MLVNVAPLNLYAAYLGPKLPNWSPTLYGGFHVEELNHLSYMWTPCRIEAMDDDLNQAP